MIHRLYCGTTGSGKTNAMIHDLLGLVARGDTWIMAVFPHEHDGDLFIFELYARFGKSIIPRLLVQRIPDTDRVLMQNLILSSKAEDPWTRMKENEEACASFMDVLARGREFTGAWTVRPVLLKWTRLAIQLYQHQDTWVPVSLLPESLAPKSPAWEYFIDHCRDAKIRRAFIEMIGLSRHEQLDLFEPAKRLLEQFLASVAIIACTSKPATFDLASFLNNAGILVIMGG